MRRAGLLLATVSLPFLLNDFAFMAVEAHAVLWLAVDYGVKLGLLAALLAHPVCRSAIAGSWRLDVGLLTVSLLVPLAALVLLMLDPVVMALGRALLPVPDLAHYPDFGDGALFLFDLTAGLLLTAVVEELVGRVLYARLLASLGLHRRLITPVAAALFAACHWSHGGDALLLAFVSGVVLMALYRYSGSVLPSVAVHYLVNLYWFS